jgi:hypothetical protein
MTLLVINDSFDFKQGGFFGIYFIQHCLICRLTDSTVSEVAWIEPRTVATRPDLIHYSARLDLIHNSARSHPQLG